MNTRQKIRHAVILVTLFLFPVIMSYFSPYLIIDASVQGIISGSFIIFALLFIFSFVFGRAFCGWVCPGAGIQEACFSINNKRTRGGRYNWIKFYIWIPWIITIMIVAILGGGYRQIQPLYMMESGVSVAELENYITYFFILALFVVPALTLGKRAFCHYICWMAPFMIIGAKVRSALKWPFLHLKSDSASCKNCKSCNERCPMSLDVNRMVQRNNMADIECILCGTCVDNCPNHAIKFVWKY